VDHYVGRDKEIKGHKLILVIVEKSMS